MIDVQPGDVLLYRGRGFVSKGIRFLDGSEVNHAAIAVSPTEIAEATGHGLDTAATLASFESNERTIIRRPAGGDPALAVAKAKQYLDSGVPYAYQQILLLAALCVTRRVPIKNRIFRRILRRALDGAADLLNALIDRGDDLMICSEYVYRCYNETGFDLLPDGIPDLAALEPGSDEVVLADWLLEQPAAPAPAAAGAPATSEDPATIADRAQHDLDDLFAAFFAETEGDPLLPASAAVGPDVLDEEIAGGANRFGAAAVRLAALRDPDAPAPMGVGVADGVAVLKGMFSTNANFVTPKDLLFTSQLDDIDRVE